MLSLSDRVRISGSAGGDEQSNGGFRLNKQSGLDINPRIVVDAIEDGAEAFAQYRAQVKGGPKAQQTTPNDDNNEESRDSLGAAKPPKTASVGSFALNMGKNLATMGALGLVGAGASGFANRDENGQPQWDKRTAIQVGATTAIVGGASLRAARGIVDGYQAIRDRDILEAAKAALSIAPGSVGVGTLAYQQHHNGEVDHPQALKNTGATATGSALLSQLVSGMQQGLA